MAKQRQAYLDFSFVFDPSELWNHVHEFESTLRKYFDSIGVEASIIESFGGGKGRFMVYLAKKNEYGISIPFEKKGMTLKTKESMDNLTAKYKANLKRTRKKPLTKPTDTASSLKPKRGYKTSKNPRASNLLKRIQMGKFRE